MCRVSSIGPSARSARPVGFAALGPHLCHLVRKKAAKRVANTRQFTFILNRRKHVYKEFVNTSCLLV